MINWDIVAKAVALTVIDQIEAVGGIMLKPWLSSKIKIGSRALAPSNPWFSSSLLTEKAVDGAVLGGIVPTDAYAKYAIPKGLPEEGKRSLVIENPPHTIDDFNGEIKSGYGKGKKKLLISQRVAVKVEGETPFLGKINYHVHEADRAGTHYDLVVEGVKAGTKQFEINIPNGQHKGRYAFLTTDKGMICVPMKDRGVNLPKPVYQLKPEEFLDTVTAANRAAVKGREPYTVEWKPDGSLGNASIEDYRVVFRSHRVEADTYYDKLPGLEFLKAKRSKFGLLNLVMPPRQHDLTGTVLQGELFHDKGVGFVSGVLNSLPERAQIAQVNNGPVQYYVWDIKAYKGNDVSQLPYARRRILYSQVVDKIREFNSNYHIVQAAKPTENARLWYERISNDKRGLPYSEGVVIKPNGWEENESSVQVKWPKVKSHDLTDVVITGFIEGNGDLVDSLGAIIVESPDGTKTGKVGTGFNDLQGRWIWDHQDKLIGATIKTKVLEETDKSFRAPRFESFHESKGKTDFGLQMYAYELALGDEQDSKRIMYSLKSAKGWRPK